MKLVIRDGAVVDPDSGQLRPADITVAEGKVISIGEAVSGFSPDAIIDAKGCVVSAGLVDLSVRLREPGHEHEGMLATELTAAVFG